MEDKVITSVNNNIIKNIITLQNKKSERKKQGLFVVEGLRAVKDLGNVSEICYFVATQNIQKSDITTQPTQWITVTDEIFSSISATQTPQGIMAIVQQRKNSLQSIPIKNGVYLVVENVQDPGNLGTIIRTAYGFGVNAIFLTKGCVNELVCQSKA